MRIAVKYTAIGSKAASVFYFTLFHYLRSEILISEIWSREMKALKDNKKICIYIKF